jgi:hypothetical protein
MLMPLNAAVDPIPQALIGFDKCWYQAVSFSMVLSFLAHKKMREVSEVGKSVE